VGNHELVFAGGPSFTDLNIFQVEKREMTKLNKVNFKNYNEENPVFLDMDQGRTVIFTTKTSRKGMVQLINLDELKPEGQILVSERFPLKLK